jgi:2-polyprenyl-6-methoxyphenol hydroxylase-like FAD-dependent oxidoreductase
MADSDDERLPALIVGAGPVGLTMALALTIGGVRFRIIDKAAQRSNKSKALGIHARTLELLESMGIVEDFIRVGHKVHATNIYNGKNKLVHLSLDEMECAYPYALMVPQNETERLLGEELDKQSVTIERELELTNFSQDANSVTATLKRTDGSEEIVRTNWLLGCDGAHSTTRHILGMKFEGSTYEESFATADCYLDWNNPEDELFGYVNEDGIAFFFPMGNRRYRIVADGPMHATGDPLALEEMQAIVDKRCSTKVTLSNPNWLTWFTISRRSAAQYRNGRAFISGDAAHVHSPVMGQGMNTGMQDALNLAWKLELVEKGIAKPELLDTYQEERHPIGLSLLKSTDAVTKVVTLRNPIAQQVRNRLMPILASQEVVQERACKILSMLGLNYRSSSIVGEYRESLNHTLGHPLTDVPAWLEFGHGPSPGDRAPDGEVRTSGAGEPIRLFEQLRGFTHNILLFAGLQNSTKSITDIEKTLTQLETAYAEFVRCHVILSDSAAQTNAAQSVILDIDGRLHHRYGAAHSCLYLIRPDGYVGFRSQPIDLVQLQNHFESALGMLPLTQAISQIR